MNKEKQIPGTSNCKSLRDVRGFTLMEVLIVVAIIAVFVAIAIPVFSGVLGSAKNSTDLANMRAAYGAACTELMTSPSEGQTTVRYFIDGQLKDEIPSSGSGYGQSDIDAAEIWTDSPVTVSGVPNNGVSGYIVVRARHGLVEEIGWTHGGGYAGYKLTNASQYKSLTSGEKLDLDTKLLNSIQSGVRTMTYGELKELMARYGIQKQTAWGHSCYKIALSCIDSDSGDIVQAKNGIIVPELFQAAGYDISPDPLKNCLFTSSGLNNVSAHDYEVTIWVDAGANMDRADAGALADKAVVYINDNGRGKHQFNHDQRAAASNG